MSESAGSFMVIFFYLSQTDKTTKFSNEMVINAFIITSAYVSGRLMVGNPTRS